MPSGDIDLVAGAEVVVDDEAVCEDEEDPVQVLFSHGTTSKHNG